MGAHGLLYGNLGGPRVSNSKPRGDKEDQKVPKERLYGLCKNVNITLVFVGFRRLGLPMALQRTVLGCMGGTLGHMWALSWLQVPLWSAIGRLKVPLFLGRGGSRWVDVGRGKSLAAEAGLSGGGGGFASGLCTVLYTNIQHALLL